MTTPYVLEPEPAADPRPPHDSVLSADQRADARHDLAAGSGTSPSGPAESSSAPVGLWSLVQAVEAPDYGAADAGEYFLPPRRDAERTAPPETPLVGDPLLGADASLRFAGVDDGLRARLRPADRSEPAAGADPLQTWAPASRVDPADASSFRGVPWGSPERAVREREGRPPRWRTDEAVAYADVVLGLGMDVVYIFEGGELARAKYVLTDSFVDHGRFIDAFEGLREMLTAKYGFASQDDEDAADERVRQDWKEWGRAVSLGRYGRRVFWRRPSGEVCLALQGGHHRVRVEVEYLSRRHAERAAQQRMTQVMADL